MDSLAHALYGVTICSRSGLAGGRAGAGVGPAADWSVWAAAFFGVLPDLASIGLAMATLWLGGVRGHLGIFFRSLDQRTLVIYRALHSLLVALPAVALIRVVWKPLFVPALAWPLHILMDALLHDLGRFRTTLFYPLSDWAFEGWAWWRSPALVFAYWMLLPLIWLALAVLRRSARPLP